MADHFPSQSHSSLPPPAVAALRDEAVRDGSTRVHMERTISADIREEREDLKRAAEESVNAIIELDLEGNIRWVSPSWEDMTGEPAATMFRRPIADLLVENNNVFAETVAAIRKDDSKSRTIRFSVRARIGQRDASTPAVDDRTSGAGSHLSSEVAGVVVRDTQEANQMYERIELEAQGIMVYDRTTGDESHTMWMVKPAVSREITIDLPDVLIESLGIGAEMLANYLTLLADKGVRDPENHPPPMPVLCRICERQITPWWFEKHTELCSQEHRAEMEVQLAQESLNEQRSALVKVLDALEAQAKLAKPSADAASPGPSSKAEYKGLPIGSHSQPSSGPSSGRASPASIPTRSRESSANGLSHHRARSFAVRRPLARIVELVLDLCDTAMEISTPSIKDSKSYAPGELRTQSPQSESRIQQVLQWQSPSASTLENENGLSLLCDETSQLAHAKTEAVFRHRRILEYSERIRVEYDILVQECIEAACKKAARIAAGELSDSSEDDSSRYETPEQQMEPSADAPQSMPESLLMEESFSMMPRRPSAIPSAMAFALRNVHDRDPRQRTSSTGSSRASSPHGVTTPKSSYSGAADALPLHQRGSLVLESDAGADSDGSVRSSIASGSHRRSDSPSAEVTLGYTISTRSRDRKRQSLVLPSLTSTSRHHSPGRAPPPPSSPLRMTKPRLPSGTDSQSMPSPVASPVLSHGEFQSPVIRAQNHHRRQSSNALLDTLGRPASPRLSAVISNPQPRAVQTSIKDFEIIKPISKGAFGSVYLSKKKSTGDYYAIKTLKKADMIAKNQVTNVKAERAIMMWQGESDFVAKLYWTFSSKDYLYLVMEYLNGGDCASLIKVLGSLPEDWTKKYIGEVVLCVQHLHSRQIVHRDLKPDNLLIDAKGHLKLTDFGLSRMGLIGRQKRAINAKPDDAPPDLLKSGPFRRAPSVGSSRSTSFDYHAQGQSPALTPAMMNDMGQPSYFSLNRESSREATRRTSGHRSNSGDGDALDTMFRRVSIAEGRTPIEEETASEGGSDSPDPYALQPMASNSSATRIDTPPLSGMPPPMMSLFDPQDSDRRFVGTPDYLAPETINGAGQDEMSDWWSIGCILFECLYGLPPFNADTPDQVFQNILDRRINWPEDDEDVVVSEDARHLINKLLTVDPSERLGCNKDEAFANGGDEIKAHPWFAELNWERLREDEAFFVPVSENPEDTEYFDARGAVMNNFAAEFQDDGSSPAPTPGAEYPDRPHDALSRVRSQVNAVKRNLMPLHIPPHVRDVRSRRLSEPVATDDFGSFQFKNLPVLEKANKDVIQKLRADAMQAQAKSASVSASSSPGGAAVSPPAPQPLESSPVLALPLNRTLSVTKSNNRSQSPSLLSQQSSSPSRGSQPSSPLLISFSAGQQHERRKTSSGSSNLSQQGTSASLQPGNFLDQVPRLPGNFKPVTSNGPSPIKSAKSASTHQPPPIPGDKSVGRSRHGSASSPRQRSYTLGSPEGDLVPDLMPNHHKRRSGVFDVSPSSSDNEETRQKALLRVQRRRQSSRRLSQINFMDGPSFRTLDVLVCEDHPVSRLVMERLLEKLRCRTIAVTNGSEAMRYAMSEVKFDIIMMEYKLPQVNGVDVARMIRETKNANSHTPIVAVTGYLKELLGAHHFDALVEKPATKEKLEQVMGQLCQWRAPPDGWKPTSAQHIPQSNLREESMTTDDSPTTTTSSGFGGFGHGLSSSYHGSREDSISTSVSSETNHSQFDSIPVVVSRQATNEWDQSDLERNFGGLGISNALNDSPDADPNKDSDPHRPVTLSHQESAPASLGTQESLGPRKQPSMEAIQAKRRSVEKGRLESAAESGDDEDEELGNINFRQRSPRRHAKRTSKLGTEMMRTNSQGSVVSNEDLIITSSAPAVFHDTDRSRPTTIAEVSGTLTPPEVFPREPGHHAEVIDMDANSLTAVDPDTTPKPSHGQEPRDPDPTPRASGSPTLRV